MGSGGYRCERHKSSRVVNRIALGPGGQVENMPHCRVYYTSHDGEASTDQLCTFVQQQGRSGIRSIVGVPVPMKRGETAERNLLDREVRVLWKRNGT